MYDWYRSYPFPGDSPPDPTNPIGLCNKMHHCVQPNSDTICDERDLPKEYPMCVQASRCRVGNNTRVTRYRSLQAAAPGARA